MEAVKHKFLVISRIAIENVEKVLWDQVKAMPIEEVREEVDSWISDTGSTVGRVSTHDRLVMIYWVLMNLVTEVNLCAMAIMEDKMTKMLAKKEGDEEPIKA